MPKKMRKISNTLVTLSSAAILAVYAAGYERTSPAADRFAAQTAQWRAAAPAPIVVEAVAPAVTLPEVKVKIVADVPPEAPVSSLPSSTSVEVPDVVEAPAGLPEIATLPSTVALAGIQPAGELPAPPAPPQSLYKDGTYFGWGYSRHGNIEASVVIQDGRIASAEISRCLTRYPCSVVAQLPGQVTSRQSPTVDYISGATQSVGAYHDAVAEALAKAK